MKTITILSGKGGVGKSSITASLALMLSKKNKAIVAMAEAQARNVQINRIATTLPDGWTWTLIDDVGVPVCPSNHIVKDRGSDVIMCPTCGASGIIIIERTPVAKQSSFKRLFRWLRDQSI